MSVDKRSVFTDALETLGTVITPNEKRDAIHLAVEPVAAGEFLMPGEDVGIHSDGRAYKEKGTKIGIVDPFLKEGIYPDQMFWLVIYPRKINSLRHVWTHPDLPDTVDLAPQAIPTGRKDVSERWIRDFMNEHDLGPNDSDDYGKYTYQSFIDTLLSSVGDEYVHMGTEIYGNVPDELWRHLEVVTGKTIKQADRPTSFSCAC